MADLVLCDGLLPAGRRVDLHVDIGRIEGSGRPRIRQGRRPRRTGLGPHRERPPIRNLAPEDYVTNEYIDPNISGT